MWACFLLGLRGQRKTRTSLKIFQRHRCCCHHREERGSWVCCKYNSRQSGGLWGVADASSSKREACVREWGHDLTPREPETCAGAQSIPTPTSRNGRDKQASRQGRKEGKEHPRTKSSCSHCEMPLSLLRLLALDGQIPEKSQGGQSTANSLPQRLQDPEPRSNTQKSGSQL